jgi:hypothetical protein
VTSTSSRDSMRFSMVNVLLLDFRGRCMAQQEETAEAAEDHVRSCERYQLSCNCCSLPAGCSSAVYTTFRRDTVMLPVHPAVQLYMTWTSTEHIVCCLVAENRLIDRCVS